MNHEQEPDGSAVLWIVALTLGALLLLALLLPGCAVPDAYIEADHATWAVIAPEYRAYVDRDPALAEDQKVRRRLLLDSWLDRLEEFGAR